MSYLDDIMKEEVPVITFGSLTDTGLVRHGFSTRKGGVSTGCLSSMNLGFNRGDKEENVKKNFSILAQRLHMPYNSMVLSSQTHTVNVRRVTLQDKGKGIIKPKDYDNVDGLITDIPGIPLVTFYADCVPLFFLDPVRKAIGLSHSGWKGTVNKMGLVTVRAMEKEYGSRPEDMIACIGPSICVKCYEVSKELADRFREAFHSEEMFYQNADGKYQLDLWKANEMVLIEAGIRKANIENLRICTCCNKNELFSHRATNGRRGNMGAFLELVEESD